MKTAEKYASDEENFDDSEKSRDHADGSDKLKLAFPHSRQLGPMQTHNADGQRDDGDSMNQKAGYPRLYHVTDFVSPEEHEPKPTKEQSNPCGSRAGEPAHWQIEFHTF
jgi:hypothetical protein